MDVEGVWMASNMSVRNPSLSINRSYFPHHWSIMDRHVGRLHVR